MEDAPLSGDPPDAAVLPAAGSRTAGDVIPDAPTGHDLIVIGGSAGSVAVLMDLVRGLPADLRAGVFVVVHRGQQRPWLLSDVLQRHTALKVADAVDRAPIRYGEIRIAPPDRHLLIETGAMRVVRGPKENRFRPSIDPLFRSAAWAYGPRVIALLLSGMMDDGSAGMWAVKTCGGIAVVQDPGDAEFPDMPQNARDRIPVDHCVPAADLPALLQRLTLVPPARLGRPAAGAELEREIRFTEEEGSSNMSTLGEIGALSPFTCPSCHGSMWEIRDPNILRYRCHTGHAFTAATLTEMQDEHVEDALFTAMAALEEKIQLGRVMAQRFRDSGNHASADFYQERVDRSQRSLEILQGLVR
jgi:two-component system, chemotaxis family, protein-glutamate methylesterase/glutaminase